DTGTHGMSGYFSEPRDSFSYLKESSDSTELTLEQKYISFCHHGLDDNIYCDGDLHEMCDEVSNLSFAKFYDQVPHVIELESGQALD
ncbi:hypothetical protein Dimus_007554, partial [Dionaea muscipula]